MNKPRLATTFILAVVLISIAEPSPAQPTSVQLLLKREYGRALFSECRLDVTIFDGKGRSGVVCSGGAGPERPGTVSRDRALTAGEVSEILKLSRASDFFAGGHVGTDSTAVDGLFETLKVMESGRTAVLVSSGNDTFTSGSRRELIRMLHTILNELQRAATQE